MSIVQARHAIADDFIERVDTAAKFNVGERFTFEKAGV
jgi:hypothetical protein